MKLSHFLVDVGRVVAYYPRLKKVTGSTTATILLSQFMYWSDKAKDGWIFKTSEEVEEETGLTYNEQRTARKALVDLKLLQEKRHRLDHNIAFKVNTKELNRQWEVLHPRKDEEETEEVVPIELEDVVPEEQEVTEVVTVETPKIIAPPSPPRRSDVVKKGDAVDGMLYFMQSEGMEKEKAMDVIRGKIHMNLHVNPDNKKWVQFIEYAYKRETKYNEPFDKFIEYAITEGFNPIYWTPEKMITLYPQAYIKKNEVLSSSFVSTLPELPSEEIVSMPREMKNKN